MTFNESFEIPTIAPIGGDDTATAGTPTESTPVLNWRGEFVGNGIRYQILIERPHGRTDIYRDLTVIYDEGAVIEWTCDDKMSPIVGSALTLQLLTASDREFLELYTTKVGSVKCTVKRATIDPENPALTTYTTCWQGTLDVEQFEEPYVTDKGYVTMLTFSDFGALERLNWPHHNKMMTLREIITDMMTKLQMRGSVYLYTGATVGGAALSLSNVSVDTSLFYDEFEPKNYREVIEEVLKPLGLRIQQIRNGVCVYDLAGLYAIESMALTADDFTDTDAQLSIDKIYNRVTVSYDPQAENVIADGNIDADGVLKGVATKRWMTGTDSRDETKKYFAPGFDMALDYYNKDRDKLPEGLTINSKCKLFRIYPQYSASAMAGVMYACRSNEISTTDEVVPGQEERYQAILFAANGTDFAPFSTQEAVMTLKTKPVDLRHGVDYSFAVSVELMCDPRYNPFESAALENEEGNSADFQQWMRFAYVPCRLILRDMNGVARYYCDNTATKNNTSNYRQLDEWKPVTSEASLGWDFWLCWYDWQDRKGKAGVGDFTENKQTIGYYGGALPIHWEKRGGGHFIDINRLMVDLAGSTDTMFTIELQIGSGVWANKDTTATDGKWERCPLRWLAYKSPKIEIYRQSGQALDDSDTGIVEVSAELDPDACDPLEISTVIGSYDGKYCPARKGRYYINGNPIETMTRGGHTASIEKLLCGTALCQYATPHIAISGTVQLPDRELRTYNIPSADGKFMILSERLNLLTDESNITSVELSPESYDTEI